MPLTRLSRDPNNGRARDSQADVRSSGLMLDAVRLTLLIAATARFMAW